MKRTALLLALVEIVIVISFYIFGKGAILLLGLLFFICAGICFVFKKHILGAKRVVALLLCSLLFCFFMLFYNYSVIESAEVLDGKTADIECVVKEEPNKTTYYNLALVEITDSDYVDGDSLAGHRVKLYLDSDTYAFNADIGDVIKANVTFRKNDVTYRSSNYENKTHIFAKVNSAEITGHRSSIYEYCVKIRRAVRTTIQNNFNGDNGALLSGLLLGDINNMTDSLYSDFISCGVCHITAVSGMHIGALCMMVFTLLGKFMNKRKAALLSLIPVFLVVAITGFVPSGVRAGLMCAITFVGIAVLKSTDSFNSLGAAIAIMLLINPFYICDLGFQLSCSATAGVIVFSRYSERLSKRMGRIKPKFIRNVLTSTVLIFIQSVGAVLFTLPFQVINFGQISLVAPIASVLICAAAVYSLLLSVLAISLYMIPFMSTLGGLLFSVVNLLLDYIIVTVRLLSKIPFSSIPFGNTVAILWIGVSLALIGFLILFNRLGGVRLLAIVVSSLLVIFLWVDNILARYSYEVAVLDVGDGFCTVVSNKDSCIVIGCGDDQSDYYVLKSYLKKRSITNISVVLLPTEYYICTGGLKEIYTNSNTERIIAPKNSGETLGYGGIVEIIDDNETVVLGFATVTAVYNKKGCIYVIKCGDTVFSVGCTGYSVKAESIGEFDFAISGRALPKSDMAETVLVSGTSYLNDIELERLKDNRVICTGQRTVIVKFGKGKDFKVHYEE